MRVFLLTITFLTVCIFSADAQKKRKKNREEAEKTEKVSPRDNAYSPYSQAESAMPERQVKVKKSKKKSASYSASYRKMLDQKKVEFEKRMKANVKEDRREARLMKKPQYSDPAYFGHKRKPKKRKPGKRKLCKECGIIH